MKCIKCGKKINEKDKFCEHCGAKVEISENTNFNNFETDTKNNNQKFYKKTWFIILMLIFVFPLGLFLMWKFSNWKKSIKIIVTIVIVVIFILGVIGNSNGSQTNTKTTAKTEQSKNSTEENKSEIAKITKDKDLKKYLEDNCLRKPIKEFYYDFKNEGYSFSFVDYYGNDCPESTLVNSFGVDTFDGPAILTEVIDANVKEKSIKLKYDAQNP